MSESKFNNAKSLPSWIVLGITLLIGGIFALGFYNFKLKDRVEVLNKSLKEMRTDNKTYKNTLELALKTEKDLRREIKDLTDPKSKVTNSLIGTWHLLSYTYEVKYKKRIYSLKEKDNSDCYSRHSGTFVLTENGDSIVAAKDFYKITDCGFGPTLELTSNFNYEEVSLFKHPTLDNKPLTFMVISGYRWQYKLEKGQLTQWHRVFKTKKCTWRDWRKWRCKVGKEFTTTDIIKYVFLKE